VRSSRSGLAALALAVAATMAPVAGRHALAGEAPGLALAYLRGSADGAAAVELPDVPESFYGSYLRDPAGGLVVSLMAERCPRFGLVRCEARLKQIAGRKDVHPLVRQAATFELARLRRIAGDLEGASGMAAGLGFLTRWTAVGTPGGDIVVEADPVSGEVSGADSFDAPPGFAQVYVTQLSSARGETVVLRLMAPDLEQVCVNGQCREVPRLSRPLFDGLVVPVALAAGDSELKLIFSGEKSAVRFACRVMPQKAAGVPPARPGTEGAAGDGGDLPVLSASAALLESKRLDAAGALLACHAQRIAGETGDVDWEERLSALALADPVALIEAYRCMRGHKGALSVLREARRQHPGDPRVALAMAEYRLDVDQPFPAMLELAAADRASAPGLVPGDLRAAGDRSAAAKLGPYDQWTAAVLRSEVLRRLTLSRAQEAFLRQLPDPCGGQVPEVARLLAESYLERERYGDATACLAVQVAARPGQKDLASTLAYAYEKSGRLAEALAVSAATARLYPTEAYLEQNVADLAERSGDAELAAAAVERMLSRWPHNPYLLSEAGDYRYRNGDAEGALDLWRQALRLRPQDGTLRALVAKLGRKDTAFAHAIPGDDVLRSLASGVQAKGISGVPFVTVRDITLVRLEDGGNSVKRRLQAILAVAPDASRPYEVRFSYDSAVDDATVLRSEVLRADGRISPAADQSDEGLSEEEFNLYYDQRRVTLRFERLAPGDLILVDWEMHSTGSALKEPFAGVLWVQDDQPRYNVSVEVSVPGGTALHHRLAFGQKPFPAEESYLAQGGEHEGFRIDFAEVPAAREEVYPAGLFEMLASVHYSTMESWEEFGRWYAELAYAQEAMDGPMQDLVDRALSESASREETIAAIARHVADEVRYVGLELGVHGLKPYAPGDVFRRGFGDCKDKSLLMVTLLTAAGIEARMVALSTFPRGRPELSPASQALFDHAIVYLPEEDLFFDPTARFVGVGPVPWQDQGARAIIIDREHPREVTLPVSRPEENRVVTELSVGLTDQGGLRVEGSIRFTGQFAWASLRALENRGSWKDTVEGYVASVLAQVQVEETSESMEPGRIPNLTVQFVGSIGAARGTRLQLLESASDSSRAVQAAKRVGDLVYAFPFRQEFRVKLDPAALKLVTSVEERGSDGSVAWEVKAGEGVEVVYEQTTRTVSPDDYTSFRNLAQGFAQAVRPLEVEVVR